MVELQLPLDLNQPLTPPSNIARNVGNSVAASPQPLTPPSNTTKNVGNSVAAGADSARIILSPTSPGPVIGKSGKTLSQLTADWHVWASTYSIRGNSALDDRDGNRWLTGQNKANPVLFLAGVAGVNGKETSLVPITRNITVQKGKILLAPVANTAISDSGTPPISTHGELIAYTSPTIDKVERAGTATITVDGKSFPYVRVQSEDYRFAYPNPPHVWDGGKPINENVLFAVSEGLYSVIDTSRWEPGSTHQIHIKARIPGIVNVDVTYNVKVAP